tara:strand:- start:222 stop:608 length:387 start_codon:yes stop_codon:yes gene_type:complete
MTSTEINSEDSNYLKMKNLEETNKNLEEINKKLEKTNKCLLEDIGVLERIQLADLYKRDKGFTGIVDLQDWKLHKTKSGNEFVSGYIYKDEGLWETSNILSKTYVKNGLIVITKSEHVYYLPYNESYV